MVGVDGRRRVLLVEDDVFQLNIVAEMCKKCGYEVQTVGSGEGCIAPIEEQRKE